MVGKSKLPLGSTTVFSETDENGLPTTSNGGASAVGNSVSGGSTQKPATQTTGTKQTANAGSQDDIPPLTYDEIQAFANQPQAPNDDISGGKNKTATNTNVNTNNDDDDGESDVKDEAKANNIANNGMAATPNTPWGNGSFYDWYAKQLEPYKPLSAEELEKERKRQKRKELFAAIGDGLSALSNIFFTTQGAPNMDDGKNTLSAAAQARYDKMKAEREANNKYYMNGWWNIWKHQQADAATQRSAEYQRRSLELREKQQERLERQQQQEKGLREAREAYWNAKARGEEDKADYWERVYRLIGDDMTVEEAKRAAKIAPKTGTKTVSTSTNSKGVTTTTTRVTTPVSGGSIPAPAPTNTGSRQSGKGKGYGDNKTQQVSKGRGY